MLVQGFALIGMGRTTLGIVPRRQAAVAKPVVWAVPRPELQQCVNPKTQMIDRQDRPDVSHLLLAGTPNFLHVVEVLLDRGPVGEGFDDLRGRGIAIGRKEGIPNRSKETTGYSALAGIQMRDFAFRAAVGTVRIFVSSNGARQWWNTRSQSGERRKAVTVVAVRTPRCRKRLEKSPRIVPVPISPRDKPSDNSSRVVQ